MSSLLLIPLEGGLRGGPGGHAHLGPSSAPFFFGGPMFLLLLLLIGGTLFYLVRSGRVTAPAWVARSQAPEAEARKILAERFARGDLTSDEFLERASILNWNPGAEPPPRKRGKKR